VKYLRWLLIALIAIILTVFAVTNRDVVTLTLWPLTVLSTSLNFVVLLSLLVGFLAGELVAWINAGRWRREARQRARRIEELERELALRSPAQQAAQALTRD
jgi:lipopolysaccharide assembly protein A